MSQASQARYPLKISFLFLALALAVVMVSALASTLVLAVDLHLDQAVQLSL
nr:hypothetical protein [Ktedonobacteraceae bacterium]